VRWTSEEFEVNAAKLASFGVNAPSTVQNTDPFTLEVIAFHQAGGVYEGYAGTVILSSKKGGIGIYPA